MFLLDGNLSRDMTVHTCRATHPVVVGPGNMFWTVCTQGISLKAVKSTHCVKIAVSILEEVLFLLLEPFIYLAMCMCTTLVSSVFFFMWKCNRACSVRVLVCIKSQVIQHEHKCHKQMSTSVLWFCSHCTFSLIVGTKKSVTLLREEIGWR